MVEGNFDVVSLHARGVTNVVAPLGTAFTAVQAKLLRRYAPVVTLLFDGDAAGRKATRESRETCRTGGLVAKVAVLPGSKDPDDFVRERGPEALLAAVRAARGILEHLIDAALDEAFVRGDAHERAARVREVIQLITSEDDPTVRAMAQTYADNIAQRIGTPDAASFRLLKEAVTRALAEAARQRGPGAGGDAGGHADPSGPGSVRQSSTPGPENDGRGAGTDSSPWRARSRDQRSEIGLSILGCFLDFPDLLDDPAAEEAIRELEGDAALAAAAISSHKPGQKAGQEIGQDVFEILAHVPASIHTFAARRLASPRHEHREEARGELVSNAQKLKRLNQLNLAKQKGYKKEGSAAAHRPRQSQGLPHLRRGERRPAGRRGRRRPDRRRDERPRRRGHRDRRRRDAGQDRAQAHRRRRGARKKVQVRGEEQEESDPYYSKSNDPVRMYLRKMGSVSLLTREGEVEIAKRIERASTPCWQAILNSPIAVREIIDIGEKLRKHKIRVKDIIRDAEDDDQEFDEEEADRRIIRLIDKVKRPRQEAPRPARGAQGQDRRQAQGHRHRDRRDERRAGPDARGDAPQQEDDRQDRRQAQERSSRRSSAPRPTELEKRTGATKEQLKRMVRESRTTRASRRALAQEARRHDLAELEEFDAALKGAQKGLKKVEEELKIDVGEIRYTYETSARASAWPSAPRPSSSRPTCASSSRSPRSTRTAACSSWT